MRFYRRDRRRLIPQRALDVNFSRDQERAASLCRDEFSELLR